MIFSVGDIVKRLPWASSKSDGVPMGIHFRVHHVGAITGHIVLRVEESIDCAQYNRHVVGMSFPPGDFGLVTAASSDRASWSWADPGDRTRPKTTATPKREDADPVRAAEAQATRAAQSFAEAKKNLAQARAEKARKQAQERREAAAQAKAAAEAEKAAIARKMRALDLTRYHDLLAATADALAHIVVLENGQLPAKMTSNLAKFKDELAPLVAEFGYKIVVANGHGIVSR